MAMAVECFCRQHQDRDVDQRRQQQRDHRIGAGQAQGAARALF